MQQQRWDDAPAARWAALAGRLRADADALVAEFVDRVRAIGPYGRGVVPHEVLEADADRTFDYLLRRVAGQPVPERLLDIGPSIGRDRARRGVPLNDLLTAVRLDFRVLWAGLRERADPDDEPLLVSRVEDVWAAVEDYTTQIQVSYQAEAALLARERQGERTMLVAALLAGRDPDPDEVERLAVALDVDVDADLLVAAATAAAGPALRRAADRLGADGRMVHVQSTGRHVVLIARWEGGTGAPVRAALAGVPCGVGPLAHGLANVPRSARIAGEIVDVSPRADGPCELADAWLPLAAARLEDAAAELVGSELAGLADVPVRERDRLLAAVRAYLATGSVAQVAARLYCHRNTVLNRLRRFTELTGRDVTVPADAAVVLLALQCTRTQ
ncbi:PucR-like helix-turn-helix protein [Pseudonocardia hierapolitana]|uniref:PucR-like helix-turn-helix protein n=1 Tax=Pseudonocardia hierapolitana TaxID=1128676 RepID=A0A561SXY8_9PSEU|nr:helix-turn-helix domain-containing protein [Pseudonocardia hierapolitana]TWF79711.1 PucR-like helix-turn-helix protein [Pseudonocardia hierapolitana]